VHEAVNGAIKGEPPEMKRYGFCPVCGARLPSVADPAGVVKKHDCAACGFEFWQNSKPTVSALIERTVGGETRLLLVRRAIEPYKGMWGIPGGFLENGEPPEDGLRREMREELGVVLETACLFTVQVGDYPSAEAAVEARFLISLYYRCAILEDAVPVAGDDAAECAWFPLNALPAEIAFTQNSRALEALLKAGARR
jgi:ADP-ribose pyrophosphatase YjhB (NUDIX family)